MSLGARRTCVDCDFSLQFVILVIDSTDRERLSINKEELYRMLNCEVWILFIRVSHSPNITLNIRILT
jgi:hypothetical protein